MNFFNCIQNDQVHMIDFKIGKQTPHIHFCNSNQNALHENQGLFGVVKI